MTTWEPYREALRVTLMRTGAIALVVGAVIARPWSGGGGLARWGLAAALMLWPALGGHWVEVGFLNGLRPRISAEPSVQVGTRLGVWFVGGMALALGMVATAAGLGVRAEFVNISLDGQYDALAQDKVDVLISALPFIYEKQKEVRW